MVLSDSDSEDDTAELSDKTRLLARNTSAFSAARARSPEEDGGGGGAADNGNNAVGEDGEGGGGALPQKRLRAMSAQAIEIAENAAIIQGREKDRVEARREEDARKRVKSRDVKRFSSADYFKKAGVTAENRHARTEEEAKLNEELKQGGTMELDDLKSELRGSDLKTLEAAQRLAKEESSLVPDVTIFVEAERRTRMKPHLRLPPATEAAPHPARAKELVAYANDPESEQLDEMLLVGGVSKIVIAGGVATEAFTNAVLDWLFSFICWHKSQEVVDAVLESMLTIANAGSKLSGKGALGTNIPISPRKGSRPTDNAGGGGSAGADSDCSREARLEAMFKALALCAAPFKPRAASITTITGTTLATEPAPATASNSTAESKGKSKGKGISDSQWPSYSRWLTMYFSEYSASTPHTRVLMIKSLPLGGRAQGVKYRSLIKLVAELARMASTDSGDTTPLKGAFAPLKRTISARTETEPVAAHAVVPVTKGELLHNLCVAVKSLSKKVPKRPEPFIRCIVETAAVAIDHCIGTILQNKPATGRRPTESMAALASTVNRWTSKISDKDKGGGFSVACARQKDIVREVHRRLTILSGGALIGGSNSSGGGKAAKRASQEATPQQGMLSFASGSKQLQTSGSA
eukprot:gene13402-123_t